MEIYFGAKAEKAIRDYIRELDPAKKQEIYIVRIQSAFAKLVENIINMPKFSFKKMGSFQSLHDEVMAHLYSNIEKFNPRKLSKKTRKRVRAFSYFGTIAKNYLVQQSIKRSKTNYLHEDYSGKEVDINNLLIIASESTEKKIEINEFFKTLIDHFEKERENFPLDKRKICDAIIYFLQNVEKETIYNKKHFYLLLRELTGLNAKEITMMLNDFKKEYQQIKKNFIEGKI